MRQEPNEGPTATPSPQPAAELDLRPEPNIITETLKLDTSVVAKITSTDIARIGLSILLVGILGFAVIVSVIAVSTNGKNEGAIEALLKVILSPLIGLACRIRGGLLFRGEGRGWIDAAQRLALTVHADWLLAWITAGLRSGS